MKIYLLLGHPDSASYNGAIAHAYCQKAQELGHEVRFQKVGDLKFDPILHKGYKEIQALEPDLAQAQENLLWCDHWVVVYPMWWGSVPALFKGFLDRTLVPGFAFKYHKNDPMWDKLLKGRSGEIIRTSDAPTIWICLMYGNSDLGMIKNATMNFCGIKPVRVHRIDRVKDRSMEELEKKIQKVIHSIPKLRN
ncbi:MAG: NAD(P)H-dependent oxidoreductase [Flavobacteriales bacterium]|nr:NAD(P)H-dependent oxidoreductase [Flavobacteriales bacterium]